MVSLPQRMRKLQTRLLEIRLGSGAVVLPKDVKRVHMQFYKKMNGGHMGPKKFWRHELVRLKYHNPAVPMTVSYTDSSDDPAVMSVHLTSSDAPQTSSSATASPAPGAATTERVETINMKNFTNSEILDALLRLTKAQPIEPAAEDLEELAKLEDQRQKSARDSKLSQEVRARKKREQQLLEQARGDVAAQNA